MIVVAAALGFVVGVAAVAGGYWLANRLSA